MFLLAVCFTWAPVDFAVVVNERQVLASVIDILQRTR